MPGVAKVARKSQFASHNWRIKLCTRCVVCQANYLNPADQGCRYDEYPTGLFRSLIFRYMGYHQSRAGCADTATAQ